jgi:hypothetical protein
MGALPGYLASVWLTPTTGSVAFTNLNLVDSGDHKTFNVTVNDAKRYWDPSVALTVQTAPDGSTWTTANPSTYTVRYVNGQVVFASAVTGGTPSARVSAGNYFPLSFLGDAKSVNLKPQLDVQDVTTWQNPSVGWKTKLALLGDVDISLGKYWVDTTFLGYLGNRLVVVAYDGENPNQRFECFAFMKDESIKIAAKDPIGDDISFVSDGAVYFIAS